MININNIIRTIDACENMSHITYLTTEIDGIITNDQLEV